ncbi:hypothetical protein Dalk_1110 [Desulfatibacillum aliphaticivorans]|uniref:Sporulation domain protein n=2 Tax=Desulfatibacillum aliphaticivorans TaxID=218208 RepID=B8F967_DESAL|nr:SPOR domain-containing protein [Desulfatibacillum aliphaticivorans]ACL02813.1 hypothetical protein Dalk_1110 [Desulfatibacillum aliphaticivorans]
MLTIRLSLSLATKAFVLAGILTSLMIPCAPASYAWEQSLDAETPLQYTIHITEKGDTLCDMAASLDVYGSCLKWPQLYYYNIEEIRDAIPHDMDLPFTPLPPGLSIAIVHPSNVKERARKINREFRNFWTINVMSRDQSRDLSELALALMDQGYYCYITKFVTEDTVWKRLRVGFFPSLEITREIQQELGEKMGLNDAWIVKASSEEVLEFVGFLE